MLIGNLGADPEVRYLPSGDTVTTISLATSRRWKDRQTGEQREETEWHRVTFFNSGNFKLAEIAGEYLKKGSKVYVEGRLKTSKYQKNGQDQYSRDIIADQMQMLDSRAGGTSDFGQQGGYIAPQTNQNQNTQQQPQQQPQQFSQQPSQPQNFQQPQQAQQFSQQPLQPSQPQNFQQPQQFNQPAPAAQQNFQAASQTQPFNQAVTPSPVQQPPLQPPPVQVEQKTAFNNGAPIQSTSAEKLASPLVKDDFDDDIPF